MGGRFSIKKLLLDLLVIVCLVVAGWTGYQLFVSHRLDPVMGSIIFIVDIGVLIWNVAILRNHYYKRMKPSFKLVFILLLSVVLILAFAGIEPLSGYKDSIVNQVTSQIDRFKDDIVVDGGGSAVSFDQDVEYEIEGFRLAGDVVVFTVLCTPTHKAQGGTYLVEIVRDGLALNWEKALVSFPTLLPEKITVCIVAYPVIDEMLAGARQRYGDVKLEAEEIVEKLDYNFFMKGEVPSYEEYKRQEEKLEKLNNEMKKWEAISNGQSYGDERNALHDFCLKYITISITRYNAVGQ